MLEGLINDHMLHLRECLLIASPVFAALAAGCFSLAYSGANKDKRVRVLFVYSVIALIVLICPVSASVLRIVTGTYYDAPDMWLILPIVPVGAVMSAALFETVYSRTGKVQVLGMIFFAAAVLVCGSLGTGTENTSGRPENITAEETEFADFYIEKILPSDPGAVVFASDDMIAYMHSVSAGVHTVYGRDMWDGRLTKNRYGTYSEGLRALHEDSLKLENGSYELSDAVCAGAFENGAGICLLSGECDSGRIEEAGYNCTVFTSSTGKIFYIVTPGGS